MLDLFPRPFGFLSPTPASHGARETPRAAIRGASPGGHGSFLAPLSPAGREQSEEMLVTHRQFRVDRLTPAPSVPRHLRSPSILCAFIASTGGRLGRLEF